jgi:hypothetical protein
VVAVMGTSRQHLYHVLWALMLRKPNLILPCAPPGSAGLFPTMPAEWRRLWTASRASPLIVLEATGGLERLVTGA